MIDRYRRKKGDKYQKQRGSFLATGSSHFLAWWLTLLILAPWEAEIGRIAV
jgi:hypothetical protein